MSPRGKRITGKNFETTKKFQELEKHRLEENSKRIKDIWTRKEEKEGL